MGHKIYEDGIHLYDIESFILISESAKIANYILNKLIQCCIEGSTPLDLNIYAEILMKQLGVIPAFKGFSGFPSSVCISYNEKIVHGIPNNYKFKNGDVVSLDFGVIHKGHYSDNARTIIVGNIDNEYRELVDITKKAFYSGLEQAYPGNHIGDIGFAINKYILSILDKDQSPKYKLYYKFQGHGIGKSLHENPNIPNIGFKNTGKKILPGMCICIEPVVLFNSSNPIEVKTKYGNFIEINTDDNKPSAHHENQIFITNDGPIVLTHSEIPANY